jgi:hypothetical protein
MPQVEVEISDNGIKSQFNAYKIAEALAELVWNSIDAGAQNININYITDEFGSITELKIKDDGLGINTFEIEKTFKPVLTSHKAVGKTKFSTTHGKKGLGRLAFHTFSNNAEWATTFKHDGKTYYSKITINQTEIKHCEFTDPIELLGKPTGTEVLINQVNRDFSDAYFQNNVLPFFVEEFASAIIFKKITIKINGSPLDLWPIIRQEVCYKFNIDKYEFISIFYIWQKKLADNYSRYYFRDTKGEKEFTKHTSLNNKRDNFHHCVFVESEFFAEYDHHSNNRQLFQDKDALKIFKKLQVKLNEELNILKNPLIERNAQKLVAKLKNSKLFTANNSFDEFRVKCLSDTIYDLYLTEPEIFKGLSNKQENIVAGFINRLITHSNTDDLITVLGEVLELSEQQLNRFSNQLKFLKLSHVINAIEIIKDRLEVINDLEDLIFNHKKYKTYEVAHIQKIMDKSYWILGEQYHLVASTDRKFTNVLTRIIYETTGATQYHQLVHKDKNKELDLVLVKQNFDGNGKVECVVVELKRPQLELTDVHLDQVKTYLNVIKTEPKYSGFNFTWKFFLIGASIKESSNIPDTIKGLKIYGEQGLVHLANDGKYKIYIRLWCDIFTEYKSRYKFMNEQLQVEINTFENETCTADEIASRNRMSDGPQEINLL